MKKQYILTERAHYMCPNMYFGVLCSIGSQYDADKVKEGIRVLSDAHPFLHSRIAEDKAGRLYYNPQEQCQIRIEEMKSLETMPQDYKKLSENGWDVYTEALLRVLIYPGESSFSILLAAHHLLCDGRGLLGLAMEFADYYGKGIKPAFAEEHLIESINDLPAKSSLPWLSKMVVDSVNRKWEKEAHRVSYKEYLDFERKYGRENKTSLEVEAKAPDEVKSLLELCHSNSISLNDYLIARMMLEESTNKVIIAADIRKYLPIYQAGSMGNYSTAFGVVCNSKSKELLRVAKCVSKEVKKHMETPKKLMLVLACYLRMQPELVDAVAISTLGGYDSKAGEFVGSNMFGFKARNGYSLTNLGRITSDTMLEAVFIPPASPASKKTVGVVTVNGKMNLCTVTAIKG